MRFFLSFLVLIATFAPLQAVCPELQSGFSASVARVLDAETLRLHDGSELRLAGILAPHPDDAGAAAAASAPAVAAKAEVEALVLGKTIAISYGGERRDRYGRHLGHVTLEDGGATRWLQQHLLTQGLARVVTRAEERTCEAEMLAAEKTAREAVRGLWKDATYSIRTARDLDALSALVGTFQVIEGVVVDSRRSGAGLRLEFADKGKYGLVAILARPKGRGSATPTVDKGKRLRLRGWLEERGGRPTLDLTAIGTFELIE